MSDITHLTYTHAHMDPHLFFLDRLLDKMPNLATLEIPTSRKIELGTLSRLSTELLYAVLENLSIPHLMQFRLCNRSAAILIDSDPLLRSVLRFAPNVLKGIIALRVTASITARQLRRKCEQRCCDGCGQLAQYLYLPTCLRTCLNCIYHGGTMKFGSPLAEWEMLHRYEIQPQDLDSIPSFQFLPATFTNGVNIFRIDTRHTLYDEESASQKRHENHTDYFAEMNDEADAYYWALMDRECDMDKVDLSRAFITTIGDPAPEFLRLHMCTVFAPWIDSSSWQAEHGFYCSSCFYTEWQDLLYTRQTFLEHLKYCRVRPYDDSFMCRRNEGLALLQDVG